jgi:hypothetical protein
MRVYIEDLQHRVQVQRDKVRRSGSRGYALAFRT